MMEAVVGWVTCAVSFRHERSRRSWWLGLVHIFFRSGDDCLISYTKWIGYQYMYEIVLYCVRIAVLVFFKCLFIGIMCERSKVQTELRDWSRTVGLDNRRPCSGTIEKSGPSAHAKDHIFLFSKKKKKVRLNFTRIWHKHLYDATSFFIFFHIISHKRV